PATAPRPRADCSRNVPSTSPDYHADQQSYRPPIAETESQGTPSSAPAWHGSRPRLCGDRALLYSLAERAPMQAISVHVPAFLMMSSRACRRISDYLCAYLA